MAIELYEFVGDVEELRRFHTYAVPLVEKDKVLFFSLSSRNKCLTPEEREYYQLGRSEMFSKTIIRHNEWQRFISAIRAKECNIYGMLTKAGLPYPQKSLRIYWNLNATNVLPIINEQQIFLNHLQTELVNAALKHNPEAIDEAYYKIRKAHDNITSLYSRIAAEKMWCDFEADINEPINQTLIDSIKTLLLSLFGYGNSMLIQSPGGLHFSIKIGALSELGKNIKTDPNKILIDKISNVLSTLHFTADEVIRNKNEMVILPGTYAYNKEGVKTLCRVLNWDHFRKEDKLR